MPYKKRHYKKKRAVKRTRYPVNQGINPGMPPIRRAFLTLAQEFSLTSTTGVLSSQAIRANGIFDPTMTLGTKQPMGFDIWNQLYNNYVVVGARIKVCTVQDAGASSYKPAMCGVVLTNDGSVAPYTNYEGYIESKKGPYRLLQTHPTRTTVLHLNFSAKKFFNITNIKDNLDRIGALVTADPGTDDDAFFNIWYQTVNSSDTQTQSFLIEVNYIVDFSEPKIGIES